MDRKQVWQTVLGEIEVTISKANFVTWFNNTYISEINENKVTVAVPNGFSREWLKNKYDKFIKDSIAKNFKKITEIDYQIIPLKRSYSFANLGKEETKKTTTDEVLTDSRKSNLNTRYVFENLIVGSHNELALAACEAIVKNTGNKYNPLFIYGGVGLGKTHLIQAVGNKIIKEKPSLGVFYTTAEKFTGELINSIKTNIVDGFKKSYKNFDVLLIDDIQFIGGKEKTQEEFFHIFNALYQENKQIVICSDRPPKSIATLEERLRSRFEGGMIVDVSRPDLETRIAILAEKAKNQNYNKIPTKVLAFIAQNIQSNVRELEGALNKYIAVCELKNISPSIKNANEILKKSFQKKSPEIITSQKIIESVSDFYHVSPGNIEGRGRRGDVVKPRQMAVYLIRKDIKTSFPCIGRIFGGRDHTTIIHACKKIANGIKKDPLLKQELEAIRSSYLKEYC